MELQEHIETIIRRIVREELAQMDSAPRPLLDAAEVGKRLGGINKQTVYRLRKSGRLRAVEISQSSFRFHEEEVERFIREDRGRKSCLKEVPASRVRAGGGR